VAHALPGVQTVVLDQEGEMQQVRTLERSKRTMNSLEQIDMLRELVSEGLATPEDLRRRIAEHREIIEADRYEAVDQTAEEGRVWSWVNR